MYRKIRKGILALKLNRYYNRYVPKKHPPKSLQGVLWSCSVKKLDLEKDKAYIINQILAFGVLDELKWLFETYPLAVLRETFINQPIKEYTRSAFNFSKNILLELEDISLPPYKYVRDLPRYIG